MIDALSLLVSLAMLTLMSIGFGMLFAEAMRRFLADFGDSLVIGRISSAAISVVAMWLLLSVVSRLVSAEERPAELSLAGIQTSCFLSLLIAGMLATALTKGGRRTAANYGLAIQPLGRRSYLGAVAFLAALGPTAFLLVVSSLWRTVETQHTYLQALQGESGSQLLVWIVLSAVVIAPITEELLFRVTLQSWFGERYSGPAAICMTACVFALVHGWRDALPLVPLSLILGTLYYYSRSYLSCVVTHGLFNGTNITLALLTSPQGGSVVG